mmetsp:Transcript_3595/g.8593  ORF Transcript_3595/g.8593 Transcript_3595/m.8593 type:complete len:157 (+) Transcript_3595:42-512(+)
MAAFVNAPLSGVPAGGRAGVCQRRSGYGTAKRVVVMQSEEKKGGPFGAFGGMGNFMDTMKKAQSLASSAKDMEQQLKATEIEASSEDGLVRVVVTGQQVPVKVEIAPELLEQGHEKVEEVVTETMKAAHAKSVANAQQMIRDLSSSLGLPTPPPQS